ncbi:MAG: GxxExxY protein [Bacteroidota bacterium]
MRNELNRITGIIIGRAMKIHTELGPGLLESVYENLLAYELKKAGLNVKVQHPVPLVYESVKLEAGFRIDILVENKVIVEIKSVENLAPVHFAQTLTYLKIADKRLGLLINFNTFKLKDGINRIVNKF